MGLTPDDIAHRAFTPSADGYHKREVRTFLERIAAEVRGIQAAMPQSGAGVAELSTAVHDQELQLSALQGQLTQAVQELHTATSQLREAQVASARMLVGGDEEATPSHQDLAEASRTITAARIDATAKSKLAAEVLERALDGVRSGGIPPDANSSVFGHPLTEEGLRSSLEVAYRDLARVAETAEERFALVDKANDVRVRSWL